MTALPDHPIAYRLTAEAEAELDSDELVYPRYEPTPYDLGITDDPETGWLEARSADAPEYVTRISVPSIGDNGVQRLHRPMREPEPVPDLEPEAEIEL
jgi:hypothetical protein